MFPSRTASVSPQSSKRDPAPEESKSFLGLFKRTFRKEPGLGYDQIAEVSSRSKPVNKFKRVSKIKEKCEDESGGGKLQHSDIDDVAHYEDPTLDQSLATDRSEVKKSQNNTKQVDYETYFEYRRKIKLQRKIEQAAQTKEFKEVMRKRDISDQIVDKSPNLVIDKSKMVTKKPSPLKIAEEVVRERLAAEKVYEPSQEEVEHQMMKCRDIFMEDVYARINKAKLDNMKKLS